MALKTVTYPVCDGRGCGTTLMNSGDGLMFYGNVHSTGTLKENREPIIMVNVNVDKITPHTLCWSCFHKLVHDRVLAEAQAARAHESSHRDDHDYDPYPRTGPKGPTGPLVPPELSTGAPVNTETPHYVGVVKSIAGVSDD